MGVKEKMVTKRCSKCRVEKPLEGFSKRKNSVDGLQYNCKVCACALRMKYYTEGKENLVQCSICRAEYNKDSEHKCETLPVGAEFK